MDITGGRDTPRTSTLSTSLALLHLPRTPALPFRSPQECIFFLSYLHPLLSSRSYRFSSFLSLPLPSSVHLVPIVPIAPLVSNVAFLSPPLPSSSILSPFSLKTPKVHHLNPQFTPPKPPIHTTFSFISPSFITPCILLNI